MVAVAAIIFGILGTPAALRATRWPSNVAIDLNSCSRVVSKKPVKVPKLSSSK